MQFICRNVRLGLNSLRNLAHAINRYFLALKIENCQLKKMIFFLFLLMAWIVGTRYNRLAEAVLTRIKESMMGLRPRQGNLRQVFRLSFPYMEVHMKMYISIG